LISTSLPVSTRVAEASKSKPWVDRFEITTSSEVMCGALRHPTPPE